MQRNWRLDPWNWPDIEKLAFRERNPSAKVTPIWISPEGEVYAYAYGATFISKRSENFAPQAIHVTDFHPSHL